MRLSRRARPTVAALAVAALAGAGLAVGSSPAAAAPGLDGRAWFGLPTTMTLTTPQVFVGVPVTFTATLSNTIVDGSVTFWVNDPVYGLAPSVPVVNGRATLTWTPGYTWVKNWQVYGASFSPNPQQGTTSAEVAAPPMSVLPNLGPDRVTFAPTAITLAPGRSAELTAATASGSAVALTASGPCTLTGIGTNSATVTATGPGTCAVSAASNGGNGFLEATATTAVAVKAPAPKPAKPRPAKAK